MKYTVSHKFSHQRYIYIEALLENIPGDMVEIQLPAWRPGRYELGNFAKNIKDFNVTDSEGNALPFIKVKKDLWRVQTDGSSSVIISYAYYAATLDAGSTYTDHSLLYINPVNCLVYEPSSITEPCTLRLDVPSNFKIACALPAEGTLLKAENFDQLADSPLMAGPDIEHAHIDVDGVTHHFWLQGVHTLNLQQFMLDARQYAREQVAVFNQFPAPAFHYLLLMLPGRFRHGVEHSNSTVIAMGPANEFHLPEHHKDLLAICCHELFHFWNIKRIRPASMLPYDFTCENYSTLGYIYEGITTYYGDYMLLRSGVNTFDDYSKELSTDVQRHFDNEGRYHYSVAESSFDTWLDGYVPGAPGRKNSIYVEGMLCALILDVEIRRLTNQKHSLDTVMNMLYHDFYMRGRGYNEGDYREVIEELTETDMDWYFDELVWGRGNIEKYLPQTLSLLGLELVSQPSVSVLEGTFGVRLHKVAGHYIVAQVAPGSPADATGLQLSDSIISINDINIDSDEILIPLIQGLQITDSVSVVTKSVFGEVKNVLKPNNHSYFNKYLIQKVYNASEDQKLFYTFWSKQQF